MQIEKCKNVRNISVTVFTEGEKKSSRENLCNLWLRKMELSNENGNGEEKGSTKRIMHLLVVLLLLLPLYLRTFIWLINVWLADPSYSHGFFIPIISAFFAWRKLRIRIKSQDRCEGSGLRSLAYSHLTSHPTERCAPGLFIYVFGLSLLVIGFLRMFPFLSAVSFLFVLSGLVLYFYGKDMMRTLLFPISFLIFAIPLPFRAELGFILQSLSARCSTLIIEALGIPVTRLGAQIHLQNASFTIGMPCSGINTLISLLALTAIFIYVLKCPLYKKAALFCISIPIAIAANILRITSILLIAHQYGLDAAMKFFHDFSNPFLFVIAFTVLILISIIIGCKLRGGAE
jgi:exosortase